MGYIDYRHQWLNQNLVAVIYQRSTDFILTMMLLYRVSHN